MAASFTNAALCSATFSSPRTFPSVHRRRPLSNLVAMSSLPQAALSTADNDIAAHLLNHLTVSSSPSVNTAMHGLLSATPPTVAPSVCLAACVLVGSSPRLALDAACALQLAHAATHAHSAIIANRTLTKFSSGVELMTGDGMLVLGYGMIAKGDADAGRLQRAVVEVADALAAVAAEDSEEERDGRLAACGAACGAILGGGSEEEVERARRMGMHSGRAHAAMRRSVAAAADARAKAELELEWFEKKRADGVREFLRHKLPCPYNTTI